MSPLSFLTLVVWVSSLLSVAGLARGLWILLIFSKLLVLLIFSIHFSVFNSVDFC